MSSGSLTTTSAAGVRATRIATVRVGDALWFPMLPEHPLAGQLDLLTYSLFGRWVKDIPARRLASVFEYALTVALGFGFLARRYGQPCNQVLSRYLA